MKLSSYLREVIENIVLYSSTSQVLKYIHQLGTLLKYEFEFGRFGWCLRFHMSNKFLGDLDQEPQFN